VYSTPTLLIRTARAWPARLAGTLAPASWSAPGLDMGELLDGADQPAEFPVGHELVGPATDRVQLDQSVVGCRIRIVLWLGKAAAPSVCGPVRHPREAGGFDQSHRFAPHLAPERGVADGT